MIDYTWMIDILKDNMEDILKEALLYLDSFYVDECDAANWHFCKYFGEDNEELLTSIGEAIKSVLNRKGIYCETANGIQALTIIFDNEDNKVLKISAVDFSDVNHMISNISEPFSKFFARYEEIDCWHHVTGKTPYVYRYNTHFYVQDKVDCSKSGCSQNSYDSCDGCFGDKAMLATIGECLSKTMEEDDIPMLIKLFINIVGTAFKDANISGELDCHSGNWGMRNGIPVIFDPVYTSYELL